MELLLALSGGFTLGALHALEVDHLAAVTAFASKNPRPRSAAFLGFLWGMGHSATLLVLGTIALAFKFVIPPEVTSIAEFSVGVLLIAIGVWVLRDVLSKKKIHVHTHSHDGVVHTHFHSHNHGPEHQHRHSVFLVGATHGFAGTASVIVVIPITLTQSLLAAVLYLLLFSVGTVAAMALSAWLLGTVTRSAKATRILPLLQGTAGLASICVGAVWLAEVVL